ncbi:MAG: right-handed parallel beta-helix repeat-containing protein [Phycisphaerales bacterium]
MSPHALFESCLAEACTGAGFYLNPYSVAQGCIANTCGTGFFGNDGSRLIDCSATANTTLGFDLGSGVFLHRCTARGNGTTNAAGNANIRAGFRTHIAQCLVDAGAYRGIVTAHACIIAENLVSTTSGIGIEAGDGCTIERNNVSNNTGNGVQIANSCRVHANIIDYHPTAGTSAIRCLGSNNSIEQNNLTRGSDRCRHDQLDQQRHPQQPRLLHHALRRQRRRQLVPADLRRQHRLGSHAVLQRGVLAVAWTPPGSALRAWRVDRPLQ